MGHFKKQCILGPAPAMASEPGSSRVGSRDERMSTDTCAHVSTGIQEPRWRRPVLGELVLLSLESRCLVLSWVRDGSLHFLCLFEMMVWGFVSRIIGRVD